MLALATVLSYGIPQLAYVILLLRVFVLTGTLSLCAGGCVGMESRALTAG